MIAENSSPPISEVSIKMTFILFLIWDVSSKIDHSKILSDSSY